MEFKFATLTNGLKLVNFNICSTLRFEDGTILDKVSKSWSEEVGKPDLIERRSLCNRFNEIGRVMNMSNDILKILKDLQDLARNGDVDIILVSSMFFKIAQECASTFKIYEPVLATGKHNIYSISNFYK